MSRNVRLIILCEDRQQEVFVRRFLCDSGWSKRGMRALFAPPGEGAGEQFVREKFPDELQAYRSKSHDSRVALLVMLDGDNRGVAARLGQLEKACEDAGVPFRDAQERVAVLVPTWNIEAWFAYLDGHDVSEEEPGYPKLEKESECQRHVVELQRMCQQRNLREPAPRSLLAACEEYRDRLDQPLT